MKRGDSMVNTNVFLGLMKIAGYSQKSLAKEIGMSENTMSLKVNNKAVFNTDEIEAICCALNISDDAQKSNIFLFSPSQKCNGVTAQEEQLWQFVVANYGTSVFSTKQLEKDYGNAAYATIRAFMLKFEELGLLRTQIFSNRVKYMW